jgi:hypothetical protein
VPRIPHTSLNGIECLEAIREGDPAAAQTLYAMYAEQIRSYLRRHSGAKEVESTVLSILIEAARAVRDLKLESLEELTGTIRDLCQQGVFAHRRGSSVLPETACMTLERRGELISRLFTVLDRREREILLRSSLLSEGDDEISREVALPVVQVRKTRAKARVLFRICYHAGMDEHANPFTS